MGVGIPQNCSIRGPLVDAQTSSVQQNFGSPLMLPNSVSSRFNRILSQPLELLSLKYTHFCWLSDFSIVKRQHPALQPTLPLNLQASCLSLLTAEISGVCCHAPGDTLIYRKDQLYEISEDQSPSSNATKRLDKWTTFHHHSSSFKKCTGDGLLQI